MVPLSTTLSDLYTDFNVTTFLIKTLEPDHDPDQHQMTWFVATETFITIRKQLLEL